MTNIEHQIRMSQASTACPIGMDVKGAARFCSAGTCDICRFNRYPTEPQPPIRYPWLLIAGLAAIGVGYAIWRVVG